MVSRAPNRRPTRVRTHPSRSDSGGDAIIDAGFPRCDARAPFEGQVAISELNSGQDEAVARYSADELAVVFQRTADASSFLTYDIYTATRASRDAGFDQASPLVINDPTTFDGDPGLSPDGLRVLFGSLRDGGKGAIDLWSATRASRGASFGLPVAVGELNTPSDDSQPFFSADGAELWFSSTPRNGGTFRIHKARNRGWRVRAASPGERDRRRRK